MRHAYHSSRRFLRSAFALQHHQDSRTLQSFDAAPVPASARRTKCLGSRRDERAAGSKFGAASHGLALLKQPASGRHQQRPCRPNKKPRPRPGLFVQLVPETGIEPTTSRLRIKISHCLVARRISLISDSANVIDDLFDLDASLIRLIVRSQTGLRKLLH